jgi:hypothetical protein
MTDSAGLYHEKWRAGGVCCREVCLLGCGETQVHSDFCLLLIFQAFRVQKNLGYWPSFGPTGFTSGLNRILVKAFLETIQVNGGIRFTFGKSGQAAYVPFSVDYSWNSVSAAVYGSGLITCTFSIRIQKRALDPQQGRISLGIKHFLPFFSCYISAIEELFASGSIKCFEKREDIFCFNVRNIKNSIAAVCTAFITLHFIMKLFMKDGHSLINELI